MANIKKYICIEFKIEQHSGRLIPENKLSFRDEEKLKSGGIIYIYKGPKDMYVGQTKEFYKRHLAHCKEECGKYINGTYDRVIVAFNDTLINKASLDDIEKQFITYITADNENTDVSVNNKTEGNTSIDYPNKDEVVSDFILPYWSELYKRGYVNKKELNDVKQSILFKYSPFFSLSTEQQTVIDGIINSESNCIVYGLAGTGKTVLITNLAVQLLNNKPDAKIAVVAQTNWVESGKKIFEKYGAKNVIVDTAYKIGTLGEYFDYIIVDESHRLRRYYSKTNHIRDDVFGLYYDEKLKKNMPKYNELTRLVDISKKLVLFYDPLQSIRPTDIQPKEFHDALQKNAFIQFTLRKEYRVTINDKDNRFDGDDFINGILSVLQLDDRPFNKELFREYLTEGDDAYFGIVNSIGELFNYLDVQEMYNSYTINRVLAGYTREWISKGKGGEEKYDWTEGDTGRWKWNKTNENWINSKNSRQEIGCIHAIQGADLNYVGVIVSDDLKINGDVLYGDVNAYKDRNGKFAITDFDQRAFDEYIKNIYYVLLTRGISGLRVYFENKDVEKYFKKYMGICE